jgi:hypothetical protein
MRGKLPSSINFSVCGASNRSFLCLRTRLARICAASPTHNSKLSSANKRANQTRVPGRLYPQAYADSFFLQLTIELLRPPHGVSVAVPRPLQFLYPPRQFAVRLGNDRSLYPTSSPSFLPSPWSLGTSKCTQHLGGQRLYEIN